MRSLVPARLGVYADRPPEYAFLLVRVYLWKKMLTYDMNLFDILCRLILILAFYDNLGFFVWVYFLFLSQTLMTSKFFDISHMQYQPCHEWFLQTRKKCELFWKKIEALNASQRRTLVFLMHNKITQDF